MRSARLKPLRVDLPTGMQLLQHPLMLTASGLMLAVEFFSDKIPGLDTLWDVIHTLLRIRTGEALAATSHFANATTRAAANPSPEPFSNIGLSLAGDAVRFKRTICTALVTLAQ